jgi:hypothetical protein
MTYSSIKINHVNDNNVPAKVVAMRTFICFAVIIMLAWLFF